MHYNHLKMQSKLLKYCKHILQKLQKLFASWAWCMPQTKARSAVT